MLCIALIFPRPRDPVQLGKLIGDILTGQVEDRAPTPTADQNKDQAAVSLGRTYPSAAPRQHDPCSN